MNDITKTGRMYVIWKENVKYRVYTNLYWTDADHLKKKEEPNVNKYVESLNSFFETLTPKSTLGFVGKSKIIFNYVIIIASLFLLRQSYDDLWLEIYFLGLVTRIRALIYAF